MAGLEEVQEGRYGERKQSEARREDDGSREPPNEHAEGGDEVRSWLRGWKYARVDGEVAATRLEKRELDSVLPVLRHIDGEESNEVGICKRRDASFQCGMHGRGFASPPNVRRQRRAKRVRCTPGLGWLGPTAAGCGNRGARGRYECAEGLVDGLGCGEDL